VDDEVALIDILRVLARRWKLIVAVVLVPTVLVTGCLLAFKKPMYTSTAMVLVSGQRPTVSLQSPDEVTNPLANVASASVVAYRNLARDPGLAQDVINQLGLAGEPFHMTTSLLNEAVSVSVVSDSSLVQIAAKMADRDKAAAVANAVAEGLVARGESIGGSLPSAGDRFLKAAYESAYESAQASLAAKEAELAVLLGKRDSVSELTSVRDMVASELLSYRKQVQTLGTEIAALRLNLAARQSALLGTPQFLTTTKSITDDQTLLDVAQAVSGQSTLDLARLSMTSQEINPVWQSLSGDVTELAASIAYKTSLYMKGPFRDSRIACWT
jgi:capsular polysaccharide biosynthesis protein